MSRSPLWTAAALAPLLGATLVVGVATRTEATAATTVKAAPPTAVYGLRLGTTDQRGATMMAAQVASDCRDASPTKLGAMHRPQRQSADATSSASAYPNKPRASAQVRVSCADAHPPGIDGTPRMAAANGRFLLVFNRPNAPLAAVAFQRRHADERAAVADLEDTLKTFVEAFGAEPEVVAGQNADGLPPLGARRYRWHAGCIDAELTGVNLGPGQFSVSERVGARPGCRG